MMKVEFLEKQKFTQWWLWVIVLGLLFIPVYAFVAEGFSQGMKSLPVVVVAGLFYFLKLNTKIDNSGISMFFFPFIKKAVKWPEIKSVKVFDYGFVGGWGIRLWTSYGTVYNIKGSKGLLVELIDGKTFVIGTQKEEELRVFLKELGKISE